jgi:hypothetical protein
MSPGRKRASLTLCLLLAGCSSPKIRRGADVAELQERGKCRDLIVKNGSWGLETVCPEDLSFLPYIVGSQIYAGVSPQGIAMMVEPNARVKIRFDGQIASTKADSVGFAAIEVDSVSPIELITVIGISGRRWECRDEQNFNCVEGGSSGS